MLFQRALVARAQRLLKGGSMILRHSLALTALALLSLAPAAFAADANAPADFTLGTNVVSAAPPRFGTNVRDPAQYNNFTNDPGFEAITIKREHVATAGGADYIENVPLTGPTQSSAGTCHSRHSRTGSLTTRMSAFTGRRARVAR
jgi:hypothetical protein